MFVTPMIIEPRKKSGEMLVLGIDAGKHLGLAVVHRDASGRLSCRHAQAVEVRNPWSVSWCDAVTRPIYDDRDIWQNIRQMGAVVEVPKGTYPGKASSSALTRALTEASVVGMVLAKHLELEDDAIITAAQVRRMFCGSPTANDAQVKLALHRMGITMPRGADNNHTRDAALAAVFYMRRLSKGTNIT